MEVSSNKPCKNATERVKRDGQEENNAQYHHFQSALFHNQSQTVHQKKKIQDKRIKKEISKLSLFAYCHYSHLKNPSKQN